MAVGVIVLRGSVLGNMLSTIIVVCSGLGDGLIGVTGFRYGMTGCTIAGSGSTGRRCELLNCFIGRLLPSSLPRIRLFVGFLDLRLFVWIASEPDVVGTEQQICRCGLG